MGADLLKKVWGVQMWSFIDFLAKFWAIFFFWSLKIDQTVQKLWHTHIHPFSICSSAIGFIQLQTYTSWGFPPWTYLTDWLKPNLNVWFLCLSVGSFVHWKVDEFDILLCCYDTFTEFGGHILLKLSHRLTWTKFQKFVCESVNWFICWHCE